VGEKKNGRKIIQNKRQKAGKSKIKPSKEKIWSM
jgi:hypothetical protein